MYENLINRRLVALHLNHLIASKTPDVGSTRSGIPLEEVVGCTTAP